MVDLAAFEAAGRSLGEEEIAFEEEELERSRFGDLIGRERSVIVAGGLRLTFALALVDRATGFHAGMLVGEVKKLPSDFDGNGLVAVEGKEPDSGAALLIVNVCADVEFHKVGEPGQGREESGSDLFHEEGDEAEVGLSLVMVDLEAIRQTCLDHLGINVPMEEEEIAPGLEHHGGGSGSLANGQSVVKSWKAHFVS